MMMMMTTATHTVKSTDIQRQKAVIIMTEDAIQHIQIYKDKLILLERRRDEKIAKLSRSTRLCYTPIGGVKPPCPVSVAFRPYTTSSTTRHTTAHSNNNNNISNNRPSTSALFSPTSILKPGHTLANNHPTSIPLKPKYTTTTAHRPGTRSDSYDRLFLGHGPELVIGTTGTSTLRPATTSALPTSSLASLYTGGDGVGRSDHGWYGASYDEDVFEGMPEEGEQPESPEYSSKKQHLQYTPQEGSLCEAPEEAAYGPERESDVRQDISSYQVGHNSDPQPDNWALSLDNDQSLQQLDNNYNNNTTFDNNNNNLYTYLTQNPTTHTKHPHQHLNNNTNRTIYTNPKLYTLHKSIKYVLPRLPSHLHGHVSITPQIERQLRAVDKARKVFEHVPDYMKRK